MNFNERETREKPRDALIYLLSKKFLKGIKGRSKDTMTETPPLLARLIINKKLREEASKGCRLPCVFGLRIRLPGFS